MSKQNKTLQIQNILNAEKEVSLSGNIDDLLQDISLDQPISES